MIKQFTTEFVKQNSGCYTTDKLSVVYKENKNEECFVTPSCISTIEELVASNIPVKDKYWFICRRLATKEENQQIAIHVAELVLPIYEKRYPDDKRPREAIEAAKQYIAGHISLEILMEKRLAATYAAAAAAYAAATCAAAAIYAADAAYAAAATYAATYANAAATYAAAYAADAADIKRQIEDFLLEICKW